MTSFSPSALDSLHEAMHELVSSTDIPGMVTLIARGDEVHVETFGVMDLDSNRPMTRDAIFRIQSITKPVTSIAMQQLLEAGTISMDDRLDRWLPELANRVVLREPGGALDDTVPAKRPITIEDVMTYRTGYGAIMDFPPSTPVHLEMARRGIASGPDLPSVPYDEWLDRFRDIPLLQQPGEAWQYDIAATFQGILLSRIAGTSLGEIFHERIFTPLGMSETGFFAPEPDLGRLPAAYGEDFKTGGFKEWEPAGGGYGATPPPFEAGNGGLVSTVDDFLRFARMLMNKGELDGTRLVSERSIAEMTRDHLTPEQKARSPFFPGFWETNGWGWGVAVVTRPDDISAVPGRYGWSGGLGTDWFNDPATGVIGMLFTQRVFGPVFTDAIARFQRLAIAAAKPR